MPGFFLFTGNEMNAVKPIGTSLPPGTYLITQDGHPYVHTPELARRSDELGLTLHVVPDYIDSTATAVRNDAALPEPAPTTRRTRAAKPEPALAELEAVQPTSEPSFDDILNSM
jgi:hypothetical protein